MRRRSRVGEIDFGLRFAPGAVRSLDAGVPITVLAGVHPGCFQLFVHEHIRTFTDLKGKQVGFNEVRGAAAAPVRIDHGRTCRARPREGHQLGHDG